MGVVLPPLMHRKIVSEGGLTVRGLGRAAPTYGETCPGCDELLAGKRLSIPIDRRPINVTRRFAVRASRAKTSRTRQTGVPDGQADRRARLRIRFDLRRTRRRPGSGLGRAQQRDRLGG